MTHPALDVFRAHAGTAGIFADFDGTLSHIVHRPGDARPMEGVAELLEDLGRVFRLVAIVSGRAAAQLAGWLGPTVEIWGTHGAEHSHGGKLTLSERAARYEELMGRVRKQAADELDALGLEGVELEDKGVMIGLHYRAAADPETARRRLDALADGLAREHGLKRAGGRLAFELRPPEEFSKAAVVLDRARAEDLEAALFIGDDRVDLPAFDALDALAEEGRSTLRVAVSSDEAPQELLDRADVIVDGPGQAVAFLRGLLPG